MVSSVRVLFRVVYGVFYTFLQLLLVALLLVTPGDIINQSRRRGVVVPILIVSACYVASILSVVFVVSLRLYLGRAVVNSIPKSWIPIEKGDVRKPVRRMIAAGLSRSAAIALVARPRIVPADGGDGGAGGASRSGGGGGGGGGDGTAHCDRGAGQGAALQRADSVDAEKAAAADGRRAKAVRWPKRMETAEKERELGIDLPPCRAVWGEIEHPGWAPPPPPPRRARVGAGPPLRETAELQYSTVVEELPHLIEARALTLAPPDPTSPSDPPLLDAEAVALLQRPVHMGLRDYLGHLAGLGVIGLAGGGGAAEKEEEDEADAERRPLGEVVSAFVATYEYARFSTQMLSQTAFRQLMRDLATILRRMAPLDPNLLLDGDGDDDDETVSRGGSYREASSVRPSGTNSTDEEGDDIDNNAARSNPTSPSRSRSRHGEALRPRRQRQPQPQRRPSQTRQQPQQQREAERGYAPFSREEDASQSAASRSASSATGRGSSRSRSRSRSRSSKSSHRSSSPDSDGTSRRLHGGSRHHHHRPPPPDTQHHLPPGRSPDRFRVRQRRAPARPRQRRRPPSSSSSASSANPFAQTRRPYTVGSDPPSSSEQSLARSSEGPV